MGDRDWACRVILSENICEPKKRYAYVQGSPAECYQLARMRWKVLISLEPQHAHLPRVLRAVRIALERAEVQRLIPWMSIQCVKEGHVNSKHVEDMSSHLACTHHMLMAPGAEIPMLPKKVHGCQKSKSLCTCEFAV